MAAGQRRTAPALGLRPTRLPRAPPLTRSAAVGGNALAGGSRALEDGGLLPRRLAASSPFEHGGDLL
jgi:hypothetical protein